MQRRSARMAPVRERSFTSEGSAVKSLQGMSAAGQLLSNLISVGVVNEEETAFIEESICSSNLFEADRYMIAKRELDQLRMQMELLQQEQQSADVAHRFHLARRFQDIQTLNEHLQQILRNHHQLREQLTQPDTGDKLPIPRHLHGSVVEVFDLMLDFIVNLEDKISSSRMSRQASTSEHLNQLSCSVDQLSSLCAQMENLVTQLLERTIPAHQSDVL